MYDDNSFAKSSLSSAISTEILYALPGVENCHITAPSADLAANDTVLPVLGTVTVTEEA